MRRSISIAAVLLVGLLAPIPPASANDEASIERFFGHYVGRTISEKDRGKEERDQEITITPGKKNGFTVEWTTIIPRAEGSTSEKSRKINFWPSKRQHIYSAGERPNYFGGWVPLDPMKGEPYVWAHVKDTKMSVYFMHVLDDGTYEMQRYDRDLTAEGMLVNFTRSRGGQPIMSIKGVLERWK